MYNKLSSSYRMVNDITTKANILGIAFHASTLNNLSKDILTMFENDLANVDR